jgi:DNA-binding MarR family transcriptional regulator
MSTPNHELSSARPPTQPTTPPAPANPAAAPGVRPAAPESSIAELAAAAAVFASTFDRWANHKAVEAGLSAPRLRLLNVVHCHGPQKMADLAGSLAVTPRNVTALVDGLEADGLIRRVPHSTDRRVTMVELACSSARVESQFRAFQDSMGSLFATLDDDDRRALLRLLTTLRGHMDADAGRPAETRPDDDA